jgi:hypothetical protein
MIYKNNNEPPVRQHWVIFYYQECPDKYPAHPQSYYTCPYCGAGIPRTVTGDSEGMCRERKCSRISKEPQQGHDYNYHTSRDEYIWPEGE